MPRRITRDALFDFREQIHSSIDNKKLTGLVIDPIRIKYKVCRNIVVINKNNN